MNPTHIFSPLVGPIPTPYLDDNFAALFPHSYIAGLKMIATGPTTVFVGSGMAADDTQTVPMQLYVGLSKNTAAWAVGNGVGGLDTGAIAINTWYHWYLIYRADTGVVDVLFSLSGGNPTMPAGYTNKRRIGATRMGGAGLWLTFVQDGNLFEWVAPATLDVAAANPGIAAVNRVLLVPAGTNVVANFVATLVNLDAGTASSAWFSDPGTNDVLPVSGGYAHLGSVKNAANFTREASGQFAIRTNVASQIRTRLDYSSANVILQISTLGWVDGRGQNN